MLEHVMLTICLIWGAVSTRLAWKWFDASAAWERTAKAWEKNSNRFERAAADSQVIAREALDAAAGSKRAAIDAQKIARQALDERDRALEKLKGQS